jgi:hypothetical protein
VTILAKFDYGTDNKLLILASQSGKAGQENKHEMPPPIDNLLLFGDAVAIATESGDLQQPLNLTVAAYKKWLTDAFKGFEDLDSSESEAAWSSGMASSDDEEGEDEETDVEEEEDSEGEFNDAAIGAEPDDEEEPVEVVAKPKPVARRRSSASLAKQIDYSQYHELEPEPYTYSA